MKEKYRKNFDGWYSFTPVSFSPYEYIFMFWVTKYFSYWLQQELKKC